MTTNEYVPLFLEMLHNHLGYKLDWDIEEFSYNEIHATANIETVAGERALTIVFTGMVVFPCILLADSEPIEYFPDPVVTDILLKMNNVNFYYGNVIVSFAKFENNVCNIYLRGTTALSFQDQKDLSRSSFRKVSALVQPALNSVFDFISHINKQLGETYLEDLINTVENVTNSQYNTNTFSKNL